MAVQLAFIDAMTVPGNGSARSARSAQAGGLSHRLTVTTDMLQRHTSTLFLGGWTSCDVISDILAWLCST